MNRLSFHVLVFFSLLISCNSPSPKRVTFTHSQMMEKASRSEKNGWISVHLEGAPEVIGYQHGYLLAEEIIDLRGAMAVLNEKTTGRNWEFYRNESERMFWPNVPDEYRKEIDGIVSGVNAKLGEGKTDRKDIIAMNSILEMSWYYVPWLKSKNDPDPPDPTPPGHCSAIAATGTWTKDGKIDVNTVMKFMGDHHDTWRKKDQASGLTLHPEFTYQKEFLRDMPGQIWTRFGY
jgi:hypothetical protein